MDQDVSALFSSNESYACHSNLSPQDKTLSDVSKDTSVVIQKADKGGAIVLQQDAYFIEPIQLIIDPH